MITQNIFQELKWRQVIYDSTPNCESLLKLKNISCYNGFDPTAQSLHIGNLIAIVGLIRFQKFGHSPIALIGGTTGMIGDPSGKNEERNLLSKPDIDYNVEAIRLQLMNILDTKSKNNPIKIINNKDWLENLQLVDFLRNVGKFFSDNTKLAKDSVKGRIDRESGISFTEFTYQLLQAYDYLMLFEKYNCQLQTGGSDQWGNIITGINLISKVSENKEKLNQPHGIVYPLLTDSSGEKFGKSTGGNITINPAETSPYKFYQFFFNVSDSDVIKYLKIFTDKNYEEIKLLEKSTLNEPKKRIAQKDLAANLTTLIHGPGGLEKAEEITRALFQGNLINLDSKEILDALEGSNITEITKNKLEGEGIRFSELVVKSKMAKSLGEVRRLVSQGGLFLNDTKIENADKKVTISDLIKGSIILIRRGKKNYTILRIIR